MEISVIQAMNGCIHLV